MSEKKRASKSRKGFIPKYDVKDPDDFSELIIFLDGYRVHHYEEPKWIERMVKAGRLGYRFRQEWDEVKHMLHKMAALPKSMHHLLRWAKLQSFLRLLGYLVSTFTFALMGLSLFFFWGKNPEGVQVLVTILTYAAIPLISLILLASVGPPYLGQRIYKELDRYRAQNPERFREFETRLKTLVQDLIDSLSDEVNRRRLEEGREKGGNHKRDSKPRQKSDKGEFTFDLFNPDYDGIQVRRKPRRLRKYFSVVFT